MRLAWFSPFPPVRTGIAGRSAELVNALRQRGHEIDAYPEETAHDFPWARRLRPYDLVVYQFGNSSHHDYQWPYALRYPGLVVLHDTHLHHARAALLMREKRPDDYRAEFRWSHPDASPDAAELAVAGFDSALYYRWPMVRALIETSRLTAVHGESTRRELGRALSTPRLRQDFGGQANATTPDSPSTPNSQFPNADKVVSIRLGEGELVSAERQARARRDVRATYGIDRDAVLFGCFGGLTPEKRIPQILAALRAILPHAPTARLLLAGAAAGHYDVAAEFGRGTRRLRGDEVILAGYLETDAKLTDHIAACDVTLNLRWPTARETSGPWLRALAAGRATIVTDLIHTTHVPSLDPRTWTVVRPTDPVCVAIDILDEDHSLRLALRRLATDAALRERLGRAAREYWIHEHSVERMVDDYEQVLDRSRRERPQAGLDGAPIHLRPNGDATLRALLAPFGFVQGWPFGTESPL
jgi:glycosyltransferase involved in cell wall biosynthesis